MSTTILVTNLRAAWPAILAVAVPIAVWIVRFGV